MAFSFVMLLAPFHAQAANEKILAATVDGTLLKVPRGDGTVAQGNELIGSIIVGFDADTLAPVRFRIDSIEKDKRDKAGDLYLYGLSAWSPGTQTWENYCAPDANGIAKGFPLAGTWDERGRHIPSDTRFVVACTSGVYGKCVVAGYKPWATKNGVSLWDVHQACTRMMRADYCGDGNAHTLNNTPIAFYDRLGINPPKPQDAATFEAAWTADGAACLAKPRIPDSETIETILSHCPDKLRDATKTKIKCDAREHERDKRVLLYNSSNVLKKIR
jgi:hypothetical protein